MRGSHGLFPALFLCAAVAFVGSWWLQASLFAPTSVQDCACLVDQTKEAEKRSYLLVSSVCPSEPLGAVEAFTDGSRHADGSTAARNDGKDMNAHTTPDPALDTDAAASVLAELGNGTRLTIFRLLVHAGPEGLAVGDIQSRLGIPWSTLSHHISRLVRVELLEQVRDGRTLLCRPRHDTLNAVMGWLTEECNLPFVAARQNGGDSAWRNQVRPAE